jgi:2'-hydroxyisoflavone reductase
LIPPGAEPGGFQRRTIAGAIGAGLKFRPVEETARATLEWYRSLPENIQKNIIPPGLPPEKEQAIVAAWKAKK